MKCSKCGKVATVISSNVLLSGVLKRKRQCRDCDITFSTYEIREDDIKGLIKDFEPEIHYAKESLCWTCQRATGFCSWSRHFEAVPGWEAEPTTIKNGYGRGYDEYVSSFEVKSCPLYIKDRRS